MNPAWSLLANADQLRTLLATGICTDDLHQAMDLETGLQRMQALLLTLRHQRRRIYLIGNGGSAAVASHAAIDLLNKARCSATTLHDPPTLTCLANDHGYENALALAVRAMAAPGDLLVAISSSGRSRNILNGVTMARQAGGLVITFTGFDDDNPLRRLGDLNFWLPSHDYGLVELGHLFLLHYLAEQISQTPFDWSDQPEHVP